MPQKRRRSRRAPQAPQTQICRVRPLSDEEYAAFQQFAPRYTGFEVVSPAEQAAAKREQELLEQCAQEHRRWVETETARTAAEETAKREAAEREARRRRRRRAAKRAAKRKAAEREAARVIAEQQAAAEREAAKREAAKQKTRRAPQRSDAQRVAMTSDDVDWARKALQDGVKLDAAYSRFKDDWGKDPNRRTRKVPSRTQFSKRIWHRPSDPLQLANGISERN